MAEEKTPLLHELTQDLGIGTTVTAIISALWVGGVFLTRPSHATLNHRRLVDALMNDRPKK